jgi:predicted nucleotidyltransferase
MKKDWEIALEKFISKWKNKKDVVGAIACGSYITGNPTKHSDIDIHIILDKNTRWRERGNEVINGILIEYFANPMFQNLKYLKSDYTKRRKMDVNMFLTGKVLFDKNGDLTKIIKEAKKWDKKKFAKPGKISVELSKYALWDMRDNLEEVYESASEDFEFVYHNYLNELFDKYSAFLGFVTIGPNKLLRFLTLERDKLKYRINEFPDKEFREMIVSALIEKDKSKMMQIYSLLTEHVLSKMGGFDINGWKMRSRVEK